jgi:hypothetical protein
MRRPSLSSRRGDSDRHPKSVTCAPLRVLLCALLSGQLPGDPVHDEVRPDVGAAISCSVSLSKGSIFFLFAVAEDRAFSGAPHRSSLIGSRSRFSAGCALLGVVPTSVLRF